MTDKASSNQGGNETCQLQPSIRMPDIMKGISVCNAQCFCRSYTQKISRPVCALTRCQARLRNEPADAEMSGFDNCLICFRMDKWRADTHWAGFQTHSCGALLGLNQLLR